MNPWKTISDIGLSENEDNEKLRFARLINQVCALATITTYAFVPYLLLIGNSFYAIVQLLTGLLCSISFFFSSKKLFKTGFYWFFAVLLLNITFCSLEIPGSGTEFFLIPLSLIPFIVLKETRICFTLTACLCAAFFTAYLLRKNYAPRMQIGAGLTELTFIIVLVTTFTLCSLLIFQLMVANSNYERVIRQQKTLVENKNKDITDSIHYARHIQQALLTSSEYISNFLGDRFFILYQPKDIVSGDFYWAIEHRSVFFIATADFTGHGVPGAFMSLLNISFLNETVIERNISDPAVILDLQRQKIIRALNPQGTENSKDGMDCVLCAFDFKNLKLGFAAANNPLWLIRNNKLHQYTADKMPVGKYEENVRNFTLQVIDLRAGDCIYTFTDGYADQFGGPKGKKFMYKQLGAVLLEIHSLPMEKQKQMLAQKIAEWKGSQEQVDDILVTGIRI